MNSQPPIFISVETTSFSGATLLAFLLNTHPQIASIGEMNGLLPQEDPETYSCSCGRLLKECEFWSSVTETMHHKGHEFHFAHFDLAFNIGGPKLIRQLRNGSFRNNFLDTLRDTLIHSWPNERRQVKSLVERNQAFVESVLEVTGKKVMVDTSKDRVRLRALRKFSILDVRVIHLVRDVRGVVASWLRRGRNDLPEAAKQWHKWHRRLEIMWSTLPPEKYIRVRYEDLCRDVPGTLNQLYHFCGVETDVPPEELHSSSHHIVGNKMRLKNISAIRLDERWRELLSKEQLKQIDQLAGKLNRKYGYV